MSDVSIQSLPSRGGDTRPDSYRKGRKVNLFQSVSQSASDCLPMSFSHMLLDGPQPAGTEPRGSARLAAEAGLLPGRRRIYLCLRQSQRGGQLGAFGQGEVLRLLKPSL